MVSSVRSKAVKKKQEIAPDALVSDAPEQRMHTPMRVLVVAHAHPRFSTGEVARVAYALFSALKVQPDMQVVFIGGMKAGERPAHVGTVFQPVAHTQDEFLFMSEAVDPFYQSQQNKSALYQDFKLFLESFEPDVVHFHNTMHIGIEALYVARHTLPKTTIFYTLHDYALLCHRDGKMLRLPDNELCEAASPARCHQCFDEYSALDFKVREMFVKTHLACVDVFVSPSVFLAKRFVAWGLPAEKMKVLEHGSYVLPPAPFRAVQQGTDRRVFGCFGHIDPCSGVLVALQAVELLVQQGMTDVRLELWGALEGQLKAFEERFLCLVRAYPQQIVWHGKYKHADLPSLMAHVDWVVAPSVWWESAPSVLQDAWMHKRPVIASDIGAMAEKVQHEVNGLLFTVGDAVALARSMRRACEDGALWSRLVEQIAPCASVHSRAQEHVRMYRSLA
jgi:glycosyltransferase involved in cell wall biosynthesis